ncbi:MAG: sulfite exporter TauE/SafE family protein [Candidatus Rokuibacteriota bacterium]
MSLTWTAAALIILGASFVMGLAGFGIALVSLAFLPYFMPPASAVVLITIYAFAFAVGVVIQLRREVVPGAIATLLVGTLIGMPFGVWALAALPASALTRLIGLMLLVAVGLEWLGLYPQRLAGRLWGLGAGALAGVTGGAAGTPGPPVILYAAAQRWSPRTMKANLQAFLVVNQGAILLGYWWAGLLTAEVGRLVVVFAVPAALGVLGGVALFGRIDPAAFRRVLFAVLLVSGLVLLVRG